MADGGNFEKVFNGREGKSFQCENEADRGLLSVIMAKGRKGISIRIDDLRLVLKLPPAV